MDMLISTQNQYQQIINYLNKSSDDNTSDSEMSFDYGFDSKGISNKNLRKSNPTAIDWNIEEEEKSP